MTQATGIRLEGVHKVYGAGPAAVRAVHDVSLQIEPGEFFFLLGPSGCGKTTLLRILAGLIAPDAGRIFFGDRDVTAWAVEKRRSAMVFQSYALWPHMTVRQNVEFGPKMQRLPGSQRRKLAEDSLHRVQMDALARRKPNQLSGGQQQRVALARALAARPDYLLLDEPLSNLDARLRLAMRGELVKLVKSSGTTAVYVTHDQKEALSMADRIAVMNEGRLAQIGTPRELYDRPGSRFVADFLGEANFLDGRVVQAGPSLAIQTPVGVLRAERAEALPVGARVTCCVRPERIQHAKPASGPGEAENVLAATVDVSAYLGELQQCLCRLSDGTAWKVSSLSAGGAAPDVGAAVSLRFSPQSVAVLTQ